MNERADAHYEVDESLEDGVRYTESLASGSHGVSRRCELHVDREEDPVSSLGIYSFEQRFGSVSVACEGFGGVRTDPKHRRKGHIRRLMSRAIAGAAERVDAAFLFGISMLYGKFGFASCVNDSEISLWIKCADHLEPSGSLKYSSVSKDDERHLIDLYNQVHSCRPWTRVRTDGDGVRLFRNESSRRPPYGMVIREGAAIRGYALVNYHGFGWGKEPYRVREAVADSPEVAHVLIKQFCDDAAARHLDTIIVEEPRDSIVGRALCHLGGKLSTQYRADGNGMGAVLNRKRLVESLRPELKRRAGGVVLSESVLDELSEGQLVPDPRVLLRLLTGHWSWTDAMFDGTPEPNGYAEILHTWFPGGGTRVLPEPYAHSLDGY